jgi:IclR family mhp operon transcriptional activator
MDERQEIKSLKKALRALTFLNCNGESTVTDVACAIGVPRTTSHRLLETLASEGYVEKQAHSHLYRLTSLVQRLSSGFSDSDLLVEIAKSLVQRAGEKVRWPLALATPQGCDMVVRIGTDFDTPLAIDRYFIGFKTPMIHAPAGLCYLAYCEEDQRASILEMAGRSEPGGRLRSDRLADLEFTLDQVRQRGFCHIRFAQYREAGLAVPVFADGKLMGGLVMRYIKSTMKSAQVEELYAPIVKTLADDIARAYERRVVPAEDATEPSEPPALVAAEEELPQPVTPLNLFRVTNPAPGSRAVFALQRARG